MDTGSGCRSSSARPGPARGRSCTVIPTTRSTSSSRAGFCSSEVARGAPVGKTGETGLAGGDHLHFSVMIHGVHVDPVEWWDGHWIEDHVLRRVAGQAKAAGSPS